jgi:pteridine reductase
MPGAAALVTGAGKRLGRSTALAFANAGCNVVVHYHTSSDEAAKTAEEIRRIGPRAWPVQADLRNAEEASKLFHEAIKLAGPIDFLINCASIFPEETLVDMSEASLVENLRINTLAPLTLSREFHDQDRMGCIVNFLDARITDYDRNHVAYHISKRTLFSLTRMMAIEYAPKTRVNAVAPGLILPPTDNDDGYLDRLAHTNPLQTHGNAEQVAAAAVFLAWNEFVTGQVLFIDGGRHIKGSVYGL